MSYTEYCCKIGGKVIYNGYSLNEICFLAYARQGVICGGKDGQHMGASSCVTKQDKTRQHRKALWHNGCPSHNLLRRLTLTHALDNKRGEGIHE